MTGRAQVWRTERSWEPHRFRCVANGSDRRAPL